TFLNPLSQCRDFPNSANCAPPGGFSSGAVQGPVLLTDGRLLFANLAVDDNNVTTEVINILTPNKFGSYINGTWSKAANLPDGYNPDTLGAAVLADGRVVFIGGEHD